MGWVEILCMCGGVLAGILKGRIRRITIVALARKLLVALCRYLETGLIPQGALLKA